MVRQALNKVIIVAAGTGSRFGCNVPKQFLPFGPGGMPVLMHTVTAFRNAGIADEDIRVVVSASMKDFWTDLCARFGFDSPRVADGGETRFHSVRNALRTFDFGPDDNVLVHDGVRPLVGRSLILKVIDSLNRGSEAVVPAVAVTDSLRTVGADGSSAAVDRARFRSVQTPQGFKALKLLAAYDVEFNERFTDDASVAQYAGMKIDLTEGESENIKITGPRDLAIAECLSARNEFTPSV